MKHKYIEEKFNRYFELTRMKGIEMSSLPAFNDGDTVIDISDSSGSFALLTEDQANKIIGERNKLINVVLELSDALEKHDPEARDKIIYKDRK